MLDAEALDLVILATWPVQHEEQVLDCVAAGVPGVLCEKSLALDAETAAGMARAADDAGTLLAEGFMDAVLEAARTGRAVTPDVPSRP